jgi:Fur family ferric uptake transcriptional regulator
MAVFEINHGTHHDHIVCMDCGTVEEFVDPEIETKQNSIATRLGYLIRSIRWCCTGAVSAPTARRSKQGRVKRIS